MAHMQIREMYSQLRDAMDLLADPGNHRSLRRRPPQDACGRRSSGCPRASTAKRQTSTRYASPRSRATQSSGSSATSGRAPWPRTSSSGSSKRRRPGSSPRARTTRVVGVARRAEDEASEEEEDEDAFRHERGRSDIDARSDQMTPHAVKSEAMANTRDMLTGSAGFHSMSLRGSEGPLPAGLQSAVRRADEAGRALRPVGSALRARFADPKKASDLIDDKRHLNTAHRPGRRPRRRVHRGDRLSEVRPGPAEGRVRRQPRSHAQADGGVPEIAQDRDGSVSSSSTRSTTPRRSATWPRTSATSSASASGRRREPTRTASKSRC